MTVAVKLLRTGADSSEQELFRREIELMKQIGTHANVVAFFGCCLTSEPNCLVVEYCPLGDLSSYLVRQRSMMISAPDETATPLREVTYVVFDVFASY